MEVRLHGFDGDPHQMSDLLILVASFVAKNTTEAHLSGELPQSLPEGGAELARDHGRQRFLILRRELRSRPSFIPAGVERHFHALPFFRSPPPDLVQIDVAHDAEEPDQKRAVLAKRRKSPEDAEKRFLGKVPAFIRQEVLPQKESFHPGVIPLEDLAEAFLRLHSGLDLLDQTQDRIALFGHYRQRPCLTASSDTAAPAPAAPGSGR